MKRIASLVLAGILGLGCASAASAVDFKVKGYYDFAFGLQENAAASYRGNNFYSADGGDNFAARQRFRTQIDIIASETLKGVLYFEIGDINWGRSTDGNYGNGSGGALSADGVNIKTRRAYIDWFVPNTDLNFRIGLQGLDLPGAVAGSPVFSDDVAAFVGSYKFTDEFALTAFWARPFDAQENDGFNRHNRRDEMDMFGLIAPITLDGYKITPWAVFSNVGQGASPFDNTTSTVPGTNNIGDVYLNNANNPLNPLNGLSYSRSGTRYESGISLRDGRGGHAWWAGSAFEVSILDPLVFKADFMYGSMTLNGAWRTENLTSGGVSRDDYRSRGWFLDAALDYKMDWGTPGIFGWYSTGDDRNDIEDGKFGRMPTLPGTTPNFKPGSFGFDGSQNDVMTDSVVTRTGIGFWGIGAQVKDISFVEDLKHTVRVMYYAGTNDQSIVNRHIGRVSSFGFQPNDLYLGTKEGVWEVNFDHSYKIYENLLLMVDLGYLNLDLKSTRDEGPDGTNWANTQDAWKAQVGFRYSF